jgi:hypothetical protein
MMYSSLPPGPPPSLVTNSPVLEGSGQLSNLNPAIHNLSYPGMRDRHNHPYSNRSRLSTSNYSNPLSSVTLQLFTISILVLVKKFGVFHRVPHLKKLVLCPTRMLQDYFVEEGGGLVEVGQTLLAKMEELDRNKMVVKCGVDSVGWGWIAWVDLLESGLRKSAMCLTVPSA